MPEEIVEDVEARDEAERDIDSEQSGADETAELLKQLTAITAERDSLKKELSGRDRKLSEMQKERMSVEERQEAEREELRQMILEERALRVRSDNKDLARGLLDEAGIKIRVPRILDNLIKDDPDATREAVEAYIEDKRLELAESNKEHDRNNGRRIQTAKEFDQITMNDIHAMSPRELEIWDKQHPGALNKIMQRELDKKE